MHDAKSPRSSVSPEILGGIGKAFSGFARVLAGFIG